MLYTIVAVLVILWILGLVTSTTMSGLIHIQGNMDVGRRG